MKTILLNKYISKLAVLNDQLCFFLFSKEELQKKLIEFSGNIDQFYTTDLFTKNKYAKKLHIRIKKLSEFQSKNQTIALASYFSTSYELVTGYLKASQDLLSKINPASYNLQNRRSPESSYKATMISSGCSVPPTEIINTLKYLRLRRNHFIHLNDSISPYFKNYLQQQGASLNAFWNPSINIDFTNENILTFEENESIELLKILRIVVQELDKYLASNLDPQGIIKLLTEMKYSSKPQTINTIIVRKRITKIKMEGKIYFGICLIDADIKPIVESIGIRN